MALYSLLRARSRSLNSDVFSFARALSTVRRHVSSRQEGVFGEFLDVALDLRKVRIGQRLDIPYELTITDGYRDLWYSTFYQQDRMYTSDLYARTLGFHQALLPFSMMAFLTGVMSHVDDSREVLDLGFQNAVYHRPAYSGETFSKQFFIRDLRTTSQGSDTIVTVHCNLSNAETHDSIFSLDKVMIFPEALHHQKKDRATRSSGGKFESYESQGSSNSLVKEQIIDQYSRISTNSTLTSLRPGQLLLHGMSRPIGRSAAMQLATLFRMTHPLLYNTSRYSPEELVVAGGVVLAQSHACSARSLYEVLSEEMTECSFQNKVAPNDTIGAISYVLGITELNDKLEEATVRTIGLKNIDVVRELSDVKLPLELFTSNNLKPTEYEKICKQHAPMLQNKMVCQSVRKIVRQAPIHQSIFLL